MKELKPGERVRIYAADDEGPVVWLRTVVKVDGQCVIVEDSSGHRSFWHRKQCRRLVKKARRTVWVEYYAAQKHDVVLPANSVAIGAAPVWGGPWVEFVEARPKQ